MTNELTSPIPTETELHGGRDPATGLFVKGNKLARGNAAARKVARFRARLFKCVTPQDFEDVVRSLTEQAKAGDVAAQKLFLAYMLGEPRDLDLEQRLQDMEQAVAQRSNVFVAIEQISQ